MAPELPEAPRCGTTGPETTAPAYAAPHCLTESTRYDRTARRMSVSNLFETLNRSSARRSMRAAVTRPHLPFWRSPAYFATAAPVLIFARHHGVVELPSKSMSVVMLVVSDGQTVRKPWPCPAKCGLEKVGHLVEKLGQLVFWPGRRDLEISRIPGIGDRRGFLKKEEAASCVLIACQHPCHTLFAVCAASPLRRDRNDVV